MITDQELQILAFISIIVDRVPVSEETGAKIAATKIGKKRPDSWRVAIRKSHEGIPMSEEWKESISKGKSGLVMSEEWRSKLSNSNKKPCTIDGITIYNSVTELVSAEGPQGRKNPNFRFIK